MASASAQVSVLALPPWLLHRTSFKGAGRHKKQIGANACNLVGDGRLRPLADGKQRDDGRHADDHPQHGQGRAHLVGRQAIPGHSHVLYQVCYHCFASVHNLPIPNAHDPLGLGADFFVVRDHHHRDAFFPVQAASRYPSPRRLT